MFDIALQDTFESFGLSHILAVLVVSFFIALVIIFKKQLRHPKVFNKFRIALADLILLQEVSLHLFRIWSGTWSL